MTHTTLALTLGIILSTVATADAAEATRFVGKAVGKVSFKDSHLNLNARGAMAFRVQDGTLHLELDRGWYRPNWKQKFEITSDTVTPGGERVIRYRRAAVGSPMEKENLRLLNRGSLGGILGGYRDMVGGGTLRVKGDRIRWSSGGQGSMRLLWESGPFAWGEHFEGVAR
jgi:hypothetical protein